MELPSGEALFYKRICKYFVKYSVCKRRLFFNSHTDCDLSHYKERCDFIRAADLNTNLSFDLFISRHISNAVLPVNKCENIYLYLFSLCCIILPFGTTYSA